MIFSQDLIKVLSKMDNSIAIDFLSLSGKDIETNYDHLDLVSDKVDVLSFIPSSKINKADTNKFIIESNGFTYTTYTEMFRHFGMSKGEYSCLPNGVVGRIANSSRVHSREIVHFIADDGGECVIAKEGLSPIGITHKRNEIKTGKLVRKILSSIGKEISDKDLEKFVNDFKAGIAISRDIFSDFELVKGEDIRHWYLEENYEDGGGSLNKSCMRYSQCGKYLDIYCKNTDKISLLILKESHNKISGRALVWKVDKPEDVIFMDRIYTKSDSDVELFKKYATSKGWVFKSEQNAEPKYINNYSKYLEVSLNPTDYGHYPYMDTLKYYRPSTGIIHNNEKGSFEYTLEETTGGNGSCSSCGGSGHHLCDECNDGQETCHRCDGDGRATCDECDGSGDVNCDECDGDGTDGEGKDCSICSGNGTIRCVECENGQSTCTRCDGTGNTSCDNCSNGQIQCSNCN
jgi:hypothetical protein